MTQREQLLSLERKAAQGGLSLAGFKAVAQFVSWGSTIIVARLISPQDYGFMEMATILTGYVSLFNELGLGAAIIQREKTSEQELSSLFWFTAFWGSVLAGICILLSYPTAALFNEPRLLPITQTVSILFLLGALLIVPSGVLNQKLNFKIIGLIEAASVVVSCLVMIVIAQQGGGVWTLIAGHVVRQMIKVIMTFRISIWKPQFHFNMQEIKPYLRFGLTVASASSLSYIYTKSDRFFGGRFLGPAALGQYSLALNLSAILNDKVMFIINKISFPVLSRYQTDRENFNRVFLKMTKMIGLIACPLYAGGILIADDLIPLLLGAKWSPMIFPFKLLCGVQLIVSLTTTNAFAHTAQGRPGWNLSFSILSVCILPASFYLASQHGLNALAVPWVTAYVALRTGYAWMTLRKLGISWKEYFLALAHPVLGTCLMIIIVGLLKMMSAAGAGSVLLGPSAKVAAAVGMGALAYGSYLLSFQKTFIHSVLNLLKKP